ncbi:hypothetical protein ACSBR2_033381 [Camellia fascicularis]
MENLVNLQLLNMSNNQFTGNILADIGKLQKLENLYLSANKFYGDILWSFGNLTCLIALRLSTYNLHGSIPLNLGKCQYLVEQSLEQNYLSGTILGELISLSSLLYLIMSHNNLTGSLSVEVGNLKNLEQLDLSKNILSGEIPSTIGSCVKLRLLYMEDDKFWGILPSSLSYLRCMEELDLSRNNLSGKIPDYLEGFGFLQKLDLSFNDFEGDVPKKDVFKNAIAASVKGNNKLCGGILTAAQFQLQRVQKEKIFSHLEIYNSYIYWASGTNLEILFPIFLLVQKDTKMYKGILSQGEKIVAPKVINLQHRGASKSFFAECEALRHIKHRNLVKVLMACSSVDYHGNDFKALVYEFMVNGSQEDWLHANENEDEAHKYSRNLDLLQRDLIWANRDIHEGRSESGGLIGPKVSGTKGRSESGNLIWANRDIHEGCSESGGLIGRKVSGTKGRSESGDLIWPIVISAKGAPNPEA